MVCVTEAKTEVEKQVFYCLFFIFREANKANNNGQESTAVGRAENAEKQGVNEEVEPLLTTCKLSESSRHSENISRAFSSCHLLCHCQ